MPTSRARCHRQLLGSHRQMATIPINIADHVGRTPMVQLTRLPPDGRRRSSRKLEMFNPGGSVKDRIGVAMIDAAEARGPDRAGPHDDRRGDQRQHRHRARVRCAAKGYDLVLTLPQGMSREREGLLRLYGAQVRVTESMGGMNEAVAAAQALARDDDVWLPDQFSNPANPEAHYRTTGPEIWAAMEAGVDCLVAGVGTGGTITGAGGYLKERNPELPVVAVEPAVLAGALRRAPGPHKIQGIGAGFVPPVLDRALLDEIDRRRRRGRARDRAAGRAPRGRAGRHLLRRRAVGRAADRPRGEDARQRIAVVLPDSGERYVSTPFFAPEPARDGARMTLREREGPPARPGSGRCTARSTGSWSRASCSPATRSATPPTGRCGSTGRRASSPTTRAAAVRLRDPGLHGPARHVGEPRRRSSRRSSSGSTTCSPPATARTRSSCSSTRGRATAARSSSTRARTGPYMDYLCDEVVAVRRRALPEAADRDHRGLTGKSSGGYGAMVVPMLRPDVFGALASHAATRCSRLLPAVLPESRASCATTSTAPTTSSSSASPPPTTRLERFARRSRVRLRRLLLARPGRPGKALLPFDLATGRLVDDVWAQWLDWDPVRMAPAHADALRSMRRIYLDAGNAGRVLPRPRRARRSRREVDRSARAHARAVRRQARRDHLPLSGRDPRARARRYGDAWPYARHQRAHVPDDLGADEARARAHGAGRGARGPLPRRARRWRTCRARPREAGHDVRSRAPASGSCAHERAAGAFLRELAGASATSRPRRRAARAEAPARAARGSPIPRSSATRASSCCPSGARPPSSRSRGERAGDRRGRARLAGRALPRRRRRRAARDRRRRRRSSCPTCTASSCTSRRTSASPKAESAAAKLRFLNPDVVVEPYQVRVDAATPRRWSRAQDLVVDCSDSFATRYAVNAACCAARHRRWSRPACSASSGLVMASGRARRPATAARSPRRRPARADAAPTPACSGRPRA